MLNTLIKIMVSSCLALPAFAQKPLVKDTAINNMVELLVPKELTVITSQIWQMKYPGVPFPLLALGTDDGEVNLIGKTTNQPLVEDQLPDLIDIQLGFIKKKYPTASLIYDSVTTVNGHKQAILKIITPAQDQKIFNCFAFIVLNGNAIVFNFNCVEKRRTEWEAAIDAVAASIRIIK